MSTTIPETMQAVCLDGEGKLRIRTVPVPRPQPGEVLVKMAAAPVNPSDLARIRQITGTPGQADFIPGIEGSGRVVACGKGLFPAWYLGKRVACSYVNPTSGSWAGYMATSAMHCVPLPAGISDEQGSMLLVNPMTAVAFLIIAKHGRHSAFINTAAASALGRMIELLATQKGLQVINIVRNENQKHLLMAEGSRYVLVSDELNFAADLQKLAEQLKATLVLDAVGGGLTRQLLLAVPVKSSLIVYGNLSGEQPEIDYRSLVIDNKRVSGFFLGNWLKESGPVNMLGCILQVRKLLKIFTVPVQKRFPLEAAQQAADTYLGNMTAGKVLLIPS